MSTKINDLERPCVFKIWGFSDFYVVKHISKVNCAEMAKHRLKQHAYEIYSIKRKR